MRMFVKVCVKRVVMVLTVVCFLSCLRIFLPPAIRHTDVIRLARLAMQRQQFPVDQDDGTSSSFNQTVPVFVSGEKIDQFMKSRSAVYTLQGGVPKQFRSNMTSLEYKQMVMTFSTFVEACKWANLTYFLCGGSLLGVYRHHGYIPWDDDIDVVMNASNWREIRHVLSRVPGFELYAPSTVQWKFFMKGLPSIPLKGFKWPNIDIFFFNEDSSYIWGLTNEVKGAIYAKKSDFFPLQQRPFENTMAYVPCNMEKLVLDEFNIDTCMSLTYGHKYSAWMPQIIQKPCKELYASFPFVFRSPDIGGATREILKVGDRVLRNVTVKAVCGI